MSIENLNEYILQYQRYKEGNYEYSTITSKNDIKNAIKGGKKIVFITGKHETIVILIVGGICLIIGLIVGGIASATGPAPGRSVVPSMLFGTFGTIFLVFLALGLWKLRTSFIVLGLEGFVYKSRIGGIKGYKWKDVKMDKSATKSDQIYILIPEGDIFNISFFDYRSKEFKKNKHFYYTNLAIFTFKIYYNYGKKRTFESQRISIEEDQQKISQEFTKSLSASMDIDNYPEVLKEEFHNYKIKRYRFGIYGTGEQIRREFSYGKIFVLKGGLGVGMWILTVLMFVSALLVSFILLLFAIMKKLFFIIPLILVYFITILILVLISLLTLRMCLVIGPMGVYYRKILNSGVFSWNNVNDISWKYQKAKNINIGVEVKIYMSNGRKIRFRSTNYLKKEFRKKVKKEMFFKLFNIYFKLGQNLETSRRAFKGLEAKEVTQKKLKSEKKMAPNAKEKERIEKEIQRKVIPLKKGGPGYLKDFNGDLENMLKYFYQKFEKKGESFSTFKIVLFGEASVRKSSLTIRYIYGFLLKDLKRAFGVNFYSKTINYKNKKVKLQIWDYGVQERYRYSPIYVRNADGALFVYEASDNSSLVQIDDWLMLVRKGIKQVDIPIILVGLVPESDDEREVSSEEGMKIAKSRALDGFIECSSRTGENVEETFEALTRLMLANSGLV